MLQVLQIDVTKVDQDVAYVAIVVDICCKLLFLMFHLFFIRILQVCLSRCYICFTYMLQVFYLDVAYVWNGFKCFSCVFASISYACFKCFICLQTYVAIVASGCFKSRSDVAHVAMRVRNGGGMSGLRKWTGGADPHGHAKRRRGRGVQVRVRKRSATWASGCGCSSIRLGASTADIYRQLLHIYMKVLLDGCRYNMTIL
jgi:hypothetical protein